MDFQIFTQQVALHLTDMVSEWKAYNPDQDHQRDGINRMSITDSNGSTLNIRVDGYDFERSQRLVISGAYPRHGNETVIHLSHDQYPRITCAISRGPEAIARDIKRRFLPDYLALVEKANRLIEDHTKRDAIIQQQAERIALAFGVPPGDFGTNGGDSPVLYVHNGEMSGTVRINGEHSVNVELRWCPPDLVVAVGEAIRRFEAK